jgi:hypothetical protein
MVDSNLSCTGVLNYGFNQSVYSTEYSDVKLTSLDDITLEPADEQTLFSPVDQTITLPVSYTGKAGRRSNSIRK